MSWYADAQLFIFNGLFVYRVQKEYGIPVNAQRDFENHENLCFSKHLSLGNNRESDYAAFRSSFFTNGTYNRKAINSHGFVITLVGHEGTWSREEHNSLFYKLPGVPKYQSFTELLGNSKQADQKISELEAKISSFQDEAKSNKEEKQAIEIQNSILKNEVKRLTDSIDAKKSTDEKHEEIIARFVALETLNMQVLDLASKRVQHYGGGGGSSVEGQRWISGHTVPSNWVPFKDLDILTFSKKTPLTITKDVGAPKYLEDNTTNVQANRFYHGVYPIVLVNVEELIPNREEARFDPCVWGSYNNGGIDYAARKQFASEIMLPVSNLHRRSPSMHIKDVRYTSSNQGIQATARNY